MKIAIAQQNYLVGDIAGNRDKIIEAIGRAVSFGAVLVVFPDGAVTGSPLLGMARCDGLRKKTYAALDDIASNTPADVSVILGIGSIIVPDGEGIVHIEKGACSYIAGNTMDFRGAKMLFDTRAIPFSHRIAEWKLTDGRNIAGREQAILVKANQCGASTDTVYCGGSFLCMPDGRYRKFPLFSECVEVIDTESLGWEDDVCWGDKTAQVHDALVLGIRDYFSKNGFRQACVALSGGIDSAVVVALAAEALGAGNVRVLMLPSGFSTPHSVDDSVEMVRRLGLKSDIVSIGPIYDAALEAMEPIFAGTSFGLAEENIQSRIRCMLTMALSNKTGALMLNTSNKSEAGVGYGTLYGDTSGALGVIGDLYKGEVYELAEYINKNCGDPIPRNIIDKTPSAELRHDQRDTDSLPDYPLLDAVLYRLVELEMSVDEVINEGFPAEEVHRVMKLLWSGDFKRRQCPPPIRLSGATFGVERVYPITKVRL